MTYTAEALEKLDQRLRQMPKKAADLREAYFVYKYQHDRAREFAFNGFGRRVNILERCIDRVFSIIPPEQADLPDRNQLLDTDVHLHAFVFNTFGALDNLAWIWVYERLSGPDATQLDRRDIGLHRPTMRIRRTFSTEFQKYLATRSDWFGLQENYRHALAHRIPLYVPPFAVPTSKQAEYGSLGQRLHDAIARRDFDECDRLEAAQESLASFQPYMMHSFGEGAKPIAFHAQLIADFLTIEEIARKMLDELRLPGPAV
jgi:hypothetical protein